MNHDPSRTEDVSRAWRSLHIYRYMSLGGFVSFFLQPMLAPGDIKTGLLVGSTLLFGYGLMQSVTFVCPVCEGRFSNIGGLGRILLLGTGTIALLESTRSSCRSCRARPGETGA